MDFYDRQLERIAAQERLNTPSYSCNYCGASFELVADLQDHPLNGDHICDDCMNQELIDLPELASDGSKQGV